VLRGKSPLYSLVGLAGRKVQCGQSGGLVLDGLEKKLGEQQPAFTPPTRDDDADVGVLRERAENWTGRGAMTIAVSASPGPR
jgi:hypothetical protein